MHLQIRSAPTRSPADLVAFLQVLADAGINMVSAGGSNIESGGEFAFAVEHDEGDDRDVIAAFEDAAQVLRDAGYAANVVRVDHGVVTNTPGQLLELVRRVTDQNLATPGRSIRDIAVSVPDADGNIQVQIYSE